MFKSIRTNTSLCTMFNRTLRDIIAANSNMTYLTDIRPHQENINYRNEALHQLMNHRSHQAEY